MGQKSYFTISGTKVGVGQMSGGTNVGGTFVCGTKVTPPQICLLSYFIEVFGLNVCKLGRIFEMEMLKTNNKCNC